MVHLVDQEILFYRPRSKFDYYFEKILFLNFIIYRRHQVKAFTFVDQQTSYQKVFTTFGWFLSQNSLDLHKFYYDEEV